MNVTYLGADPGPAGEQKNKGSIVVAGLFLGKALAAFVTTQLSGSLKRNADLQLSVLLPGRSSRA